MAISASEQVVTKTKSKVCLFVLSTLHKSDVELVNIVLYCIVQIISSKLCILINLSESQASFYTLENFKGWTLEKHDSFQQYFQGFSMFPGCCSCMKPLKKSVFSTVKLLFMFFFYNIQGCFQGQRDAQLIHYHSWKDRPMFAYDDVSNLEMTIYQILK